MLYHTDDAPGVGDYKCTTCGKIVHLDDPDQMLPRCPVCHKTTYEKIN